MVREDYSREGNPGAAACARPKQSNIGIISANVSSFGTFKKQYERFLEIADVILLQEHRLLDHPTRYHSETVATAKHWLKSKGLHCIFPAAISTATSSSAGTAIIWKQHLAVSLAVEGIPGRSTSIDLVNKEFGRFRVVNLYVPVAAAKHIKKEWIAERLQEQDEAAKAFPVVVAGDLQLGIDDVEAVLLSLGGGWVRLPSMGFTIVGGGPSDVIDHVLLSTSAVPSVSLLSLHKVSITLSPHYPVGVNINLDVTVEVEVWKKPMQATSIKPVYGPHWPDHKFVQDWARVEAACTNGTSEEVYLSMKVALTNELGPKVGLQDGFMEPFVYGKSTLAKAVKASLRKQNGQESAMMRPWQFLTKHWRMVANHLTKLRSNTVRYVWTKYQDTFVQHWHHVCSKKFKEDCGETYLLSTCVWNCSIPAAHDVESLAWVQSIADTVADLSDNIGKMLSKERQASFGDFVKGLQASRDVHRMTKIPPPATLDFAEDGTTCPVAHLRDAYEDWHGQWNKHDHSDAHLEYEKDDQIVTFTGKQFLEASKGFPSRTTALDGISPKHFSYLSVAVSISNATFVCPCPGC